MYQILNKAGSETEFVTCTINDDSPNSEIWWSSGKPISEKIEEPIIYHVYDKGEVEDFPLTNSGQFLVSEKFLKTLLESNVHFDNYKSKIILLNGKELDGFYTINFTGSLNVLDRDKSIYKPDPDFPDTKVYKLENIVIKKELIDKDIDIFRMKENPSILLVSNSLKNKLLNAKITGVDFKQVEVS